MNYIVLSNPLSIAALHASQRIGSAARKLGVAIETAAHRTARLAAGMFARGVDVCKFPFRFIGAKDWSIPGAAWRLCTAVFNRCVYGTPIRKEEIFQRHNGYSHRVEEELLPEELSKYVNHLCAYGAVDWHRTDNWMEPMGFESVIPEGLMDALREIKGANFVERNGFIFDEKTQLKVGVFRKGARMIVAFGSLGCVYEENVKRTRDVLQRGAACAMATFGFVPGIYSNADKFVATLLQTPEFSGGNRPDVELAGLSLGGSLASYAGLRNGLKAVCMNAFALGPGLQVKLGEAARRRADDLITHIIVKGDRLIADPHALAISADKLLARFGLRTNGNFGKKYYIRNAFAGSTPAHRYAYECAMYYLGLDGARHPYEQDPAALHSLVAEQA